MLDQGCGAVRHRALQDHDDGVALADLSLCHHAAEPAPVIANRHVGGAGGPPASDAAGFRDALHEAPGLRLRQCQARCPVAEVQRLADLALGQGLLPGHQVGVHARDRGRDAPRGTHLAPGIGQLQPDLLRDGRALVPDRLGRDGGIGHG